MDATRADVEFTAEVCAIAVEEGATVVNIPDTVGYTTPEEYAEYFRRLYELVPGLREVETSVHCHDDLGLAVANSYAGVLAGARQVECAVNGIGERAGNCSLEEIVMLVRTREDVHGLTTGLNTRELARTSRMVSRLTGYAIQPNKAVVGRNAFAHESGIHQDGVLKERTTYEIMDATEVGLESNSIVLGKHSGRHALRDALEQLGFKVEGNALNAAFKRFKEVADRKKQVTALDLEAIVSDEMRERADAHELAWFEVEAGSRREPLARVAVKLPSGEEAVGESSGDGPVDAIFHAIQKADRDRVRAAPVHGRGGDRGRGRPRPGDRDAARRRPPGHRPGRRHRHPRGIGPRLRASALQRPRGRRDPRGRGGHRRGRGRAHPRPLSRHRSLQAADVAARLTTASASLHLRPLWRCCRLADDRRRLPSSQSVSTVWSRAAQLAGGRDGAATRSNADSGRDDCIACIAGVYARGASTSLGREGRWMAAVLACGPEPCSSHRSAAALWGDPRPIERARSRSRRRRESLLGADSHGHCAHSAG